MTFNNRTKPQILVFEISRFSRVTKDRRRDMYPAWPRICGSYREHMLTRYVIPSIDLLSTLFSTSHVVEAPQKMTGSTSLADMSSRELLSQVKKIIPPLLERFHKGLSPISPDRTNTQLTLLPTQVNMVVSP
jgi:hypothetical protein